jgi:hypothetical protein
VQSFREFPENLENAAISDKVLITPVGIFHFIFANIGSGPHIHGPSKSASDISKFNDQLDDSSYMSRMCNKTTVQTST